MSIIDALKGGIRSGSIVQLQCSSKISPQFRAMFLHRQVWDQLQELQETDEEETRLAELIADLEVFLTSKTIAPRYLYWLTPQRDLVFEIRSLSPAPSLRILGKFISQDVFFATNIERRDELEKFESQRWRAAKRLCSAIWRQVFPSYQPFGSEDYDISRYISGSLNQRYFRS